eukprot:scaffold90697_cov31-Tisochrysis_lutea.AAC.2
MTFPHGAEGYLPLPGPSSGVEKRFGVTALPKLAAHGEELMATCPKPHGAFDVILHALSTHLRASHCRHERSGDSRAHRFHWESQDGNTRP